MGSVFSRAPEWQPRTATSTRRRMATKGSRRRGAPRMVVRRRKNKARQLTMRMPVTLKAARTSARKGISWPSHAMTAERRSAKSAGSARRAAVTASFSSRVRATTVPLRTATGNALGLRNLNSPSWTRPSQQMASCGCHLPWRTMAPPSMTFTWSTVLRRATARMRWTSQAAAMTATATAVALSLILMKASSTLTPTSGGALQLPPAQRRTTSASQRARSPA
mmetsp:Transcript_9551/g.27326  ORF Transcript_9551/g.27326 Transcript_9551/m.27326 type:complete len:222 (+) Transcript_9551:684-1349(+)